MRRTLAAIVTALVLVVVGSTDAEATRARTTFLAFATGSQEVPAVDTSASGLGVFHVRKAGDRIDFVVVARRIDDVTMAHLHVAPSGANGPIVVWLYPDAPPPQLIPGRFNGVLARGSITEDSLTGAGDITTIAELVDQIRAGNIYLNIHTDENPAGEIRGQLR